MGEMMDFKIEITPEDEKVLRRAIDAYDAEIFEYLQDPETATEEDKSDIGWCKSNLSDFVMYDFRKLTNAGLLEKREGQLRWRITQLGRDTLAALDKAKQNLPSVHPEMVKEVIEEADEPAPVVPQFLKNIHPEKLKAFVGMYNQSPTEEEKLRAQVADLKKQLRDVENERDIRGAILERLVGIREELIDDVSNSWIDSIDQIRKQLNEARVMRAEKEALERALTTKHEELKQTQIQFDSTLDLIWNIVRPDNKSWDYPAQVVRYVETTVNEMKAVYDAAMKWGKLDEHSSVNDIEIAVHELEHITGKILEKSPLDVSETSK